MKTMTCKQLGGACSEKFHAETFEEMVNLSREHGMKMGESQEVSHIDAMNDVRELMKNPDAVNE